MDDDSDTYKYYEYLEAKREAEEIDKFIQQRNEEQNKVLATLTKEERAILDDLNDKVNSASKALNQDGANPYEYNTYFDALDKYRKASEKWPVLMDGY